jgi:hypothetical protein
MQGFAGRPITIKSAFIQGNRPGFRAVAVTMAASPGGCGAVIFIFWSRDNSVKYTDPDGKSTWIGIDDTDWWFKADHSSGKDTADFHFVKGDPRKMRSDFCNRSR